MENWTLERGLFNRYLSLNDKVASLTYLPAFYTVDSIKDFQENKAKIKPIITQRFFGSPTSKEFAIVRMKNVCLTQIVNEDGSDLLVLDKFMPFYIEDESGKEVTYWDTKREKIEITFRDALISYGFTGVKDKVDRLSLWFAYQTKDSMIFDFSFKRNDKDTMDTITADDFDLAKLAEQH